MSIELEHYCTRGRKPAHIFEHIFGVPKKLIEVLVDDDTWDLAEEHNANILCPLCGKVIVDMMEEKASGPVKGIIA